MVKRIWIVIDEIVKVNINIYEMENGIKDLIKDGIIGIYDLINFWEQTYYWKGRIELIQKVVKVLLKKIKMILVYFKVLNYMKISN